jgi:hypothetical protein
MPLTQMNLRDLRSRDGALNVARLLGYGAEALPFSATDLGLQRDTVRLRSDARPDQGYGVVIGSLERHPQSFRAIGRRLVEGFHDQPLAILGVRGSGDGWLRAVIVRPRLIEGAAGAVTIARLTVDPAAPTAHDVEVLSGLAWTAADARQNQRRIDAALDVERVTSRFFRGLATHQGRLLAAVTALARREPSMAAGVEAAGGAERVALRILTQVLFCYFLQRKDLLEGRARWLSEQHDLFRAQGRTGYYQAILEPLFYDALRVPPDERPGAWRDRAGIPFLNGGLFERSYMTTLDLPDEVFATDGGLLGYLDGWTFTVSEESADEHEVAVDPEMLGKVFENLVSDEEIRREGTVYTPRPVVQFMCREALVPYLERSLDIDEDRARRLLTEDEIPEHDTGPDPATFARRLDEAVARITVLDPAVGSGAFPLGMLVELVRLRRLAHRVLANADPTPRVLWSWKLNAVERSLFGVDINPGAVELCRLRLWLALLVEEETGAVHALPNLEYRIICADSLTDFLAGFEVQQTRQGPLTTGLGMPDMQPITRLRERYLEESRPGPKAQLRERLADDEDGIVEHIFAEARANAMLQQRARAATVQRLGQSAEVGLLELKTAFDSRDRRYPLFVPAFHAPEVIAPDGWDVVIMNPPYVGRKEVAQRLDGLRIADLKAHYGRTYDLMIHFAFRALELVRPGGVVSMIFNDSIFTSDDADDLRRRLLGGDASIRAIARSRCFEGKAVNGGVIVAVAGEDGMRPIRWVENHGRPTTDLAGSSGPADAADRARAIGDSELWVVHRGDYERLPHRPLFRPSPAARRLLDAYDRCAGWREFSRYHTPAGLARQADWQLLSDTGALDAWKRGAGSTGFYERLRPGVDFVLLGLVIEGGQGLATADDRRFLAALDGTPEAVDVRANQERFAELARARSGPRDALERALRTGASLESALLEVADRYRPAELGWPKVGLIRVADPSRVHRSRLTSGEVERGLSGERTWVPFEKGDSSDEGGGARWTRSNPLVIDWSEDAVALLRRRARQDDSYRKPRLQNEHLWGQGGGGVTWNRVASYLRARVVDEGGIFSDMSPTVRPSVDWLSRGALLSLMCAPVVDFLVRTFVGTRMHIELGHLRRIPIPVLTTEQSTTLGDLGSRAVEAKIARDAGQPSDLATIERDIDEYVRDLYGIARDADLWVVR